MTEYTTGMTTQVFKKAEGTLIVIEDNDFYITLVADKVKTLKIGREDYVMVKAIIEKFNES